VDDGSGRIIKDRFVAVCSTNLWSVGNTNRHEDCGHCIQYFSLARRSAICRRELVCTSSKWSERGSRNEPFLVDSLYTAAWIGTYGSAWVYYPPMTVFNAGHPMTFGDVIGENWLGISRFTLCETQSYPETTPPEGPSWENLTADLASTRTVAHHGNGADILSPGPSRKLYLQ
jgi:hypothetical protein